MASTVKCNVSTVYYAVYCLYCLLYSVMFVLCTVICAVCTVHCDVNCGLCNVMFVMCRVTQCVLCTILYCTVMDIRSLGLWSSLMEEEVTIRSPLHCKFMEKTIR